MVDCGNTGHEEATQPQWGTKQTHIHTSWPGVASLPTGVFWGGGKETGEAEGIPDKHEKNPHGHEEM